MKVCLISFDGINPGVRSLNSVLRKAGHDATILFLVPEYSPDGVRLFSRAEKMTIERYLSNFDLVGFSVFTRHFKVAADLCGKRPGGKAPFTVWGGIHATLDPGRCLEHADAVALGESEESLLELVDVLAAGGEHLNTDGFWFSSGSQVIRNNLRPPPENLGSLPVPDVGYKEHSLLKSSVIQTMEREDYANLVFGNPQLRAGRLANYVIVTSRGCPHVCAYCSNSKLNEMFGKHRRKIRSRSLDNIFEELRQAREILPEIGFVSIDDDNFIARPLGRLQEFSTRWKKELGLPFSISASPVFITEERIRTLVDGGLRQIGIGVQSGSARVIYDVYNRNIKPQKILEAARLLNRYSENLVTSYDFIFDNPYETSLDRLETARLINAFPKPYALQSFSLVFLPGTKLTEKAIKDGIIGSDLYAGYERRTNYFSTNRVSYLKLVCLLLPSLPARIGALLTFKPLALLLDSRILESVFTLSARTLFWIKATLQLRRTNTTSVLRRK